MKRLRVLLVVHPEDAVVNAGSDQLRAMADEIAAWGSRGMFSQQSPRNISRMVSLAPLVAFDDLPAETQEDIAGWIAERADIQVLADYALDTWGPGQTFDLETVRANLHGMATPPLFKVEDLPVASITRYARSPSPSVVAQYAKRMRQGERPPPILVDAAKFVDGGHRFGAALKSHSPTIPTVDIGPLLRMDWASWLKDETNATHPVKGGMY